MSGLLSRRSWSGTPALGFVRLGGQRFDPVEHDNKLGSLTIDSPFIGSGWRFGIGSTSRVAAWRSPTTARRDTSTSAATSASIAATHHVSTAATTTLGATTATKATT